MTTKIRLSMQDYTLHFIGWTLKNATISCIVGWGVLAVGIIGVMVTLGAAITLPAWIALDFILVVSLSECAGWGIALYKLKDVLNPAIYFYTDGNDD